MHLLLIKQPIGALSDDLWSVQFSEGADDEDKYDFQNLQVVAEKGLQVFTFKQLHSATGGFSKSNVVGHGGFGLVYRGVLNDGRKVAIKLMDQAGQQGEEEFKVEVRSCYTFCSLLLCLVPWMRRAKGDDFEDIYFYQLCKIFIVFFFF